MKKITYILMTLLIAIVLTGCFGSDAKDAAFKKCLDETKPLNAETIDSMFADATDLQVPADVFSPVVIENTKISIETTEVDADIYVWQEEQKIYINAPVSEVGTSTESRYLDLNQLEEMYDSYLEQLSQITTTKPSELYEMVMEEYGYELGLAQTIWTERSLDELLEIFNYKYTDFRKVSDGKYAVKDEVLFAKLLKWSYQEVTVEEFIGMLTESQIQMNLYVYFDGTYINAYEAVIKSTAEGQTEEVKLKLSFLYNDEEFIGLKLEAFVSGYEISLEIKVVENSLFVEFVLEVPSVQTMIISLKVSSNSLEFNITNNEVVICNVDLQYAVDQVGNSAKISLSGSIVYEDTTITIVNGSDVVVPSDRLATKDTALNLLESISVG